MYASLNKDTIENNFKTYDMAWNYIDYPLLMCEKSNKTNIIKYHLHTRCS